jgi:hypothetical protein
MIRRIAVLITALTLVSATSALAAAADGDCTLAGVGLDAGEQSTAPEGIKDPTGLCESLSP